FISLFLPNVGFLSVKTKILLLVNIKSLSFATMILSFIKMEVLVHEAGNKKVVKVGVAFSKEEKNITDWIVE
ncbi:MAG: hypothetical protein II630_10100, partial [Bacteroidales bacterium]|nr:hypothetical protein [Bacteroidales bacterium]